MKFEELKNDLPAVINKVSAFLGKSYDPDQIKKLQEHLSFENMKNNPAVNYQHIVDVNRKYGFIEAEGSFMRSGTVGDFKAHLTKEQIDEIEKWTQENLKGTDFIM